MRARDFLARLEGVRPIATGGHVARCPAHADTHQSLKVDEGDDSRVLIRCYVGCSPDEIVAALGLTMRDLMPERDDYRPPPVKQAPKSKAEAVPRKVVRETPYVLTLPDGTKLEHIRLDYADGGKAFTWRRNGAPGLGGLSTRDIPLYHAGGSGLAVICEGEKAALAAASLGCEAWGTVCGASACPSPAVLGVVRGRDVTLWPDADMPGAAHMLKLAEAVKKVARSVLVVAWGKAESGEDAADFVAQGGTAESCSALLEGATRVYGPPKLKRLADGVKVALAELDRYSAHDWSGRVQTGIYELDQRMLGGLRPGRVTLLGACTGAGKTTLAQQIATHCARKQGPALFVSPEMSVEELAEREVIRESGRSMQRRAPRNAKHEDFDATIAAHSQAAAAIQRESLPVYVLDDAATMDDVEAAAEAIEGLRLVIIDYAQEVADGSDQRKARYLAVGDVARRGVRLAQKLKVPVLIASQLNEVKGKNGETTGYEFRETKVLEQKAAVVWLLIVKWDETPQRDRFATAKLVCRKHRGGPQFVLDLHYSPELFLLGAKVDQVEEWQGRLEDVAR